MRGPGSEAQEVPPALRGPRPLSACRWGLRARRELGSLAHGQRGKGVTDVTNARSPSSCCSDGGSRRTYPSESPTWLTCVIWPLNGLRFWPTDPSPSYWPLTVCRGTWSRWPCPSPPNSGGPAIPLRRILLAALWPEPPVPESHRGAARVVACLGVESGRPTWVLGHRELAG